MTATVTDYKILERLRRICPQATVEDVNVLRRAELTLQRWSEGECGNGNDFCSWSIERDEETGIPYRVTYPHDSKSYRTRIADREAGALKRIKAVCDRLGIHYFHQGDPRGCALYVSREALTDSNYTNGIAVCA